MSRYKKKCLLLCTLVTCFFWPALAQQTDINRYAGCNGESNWRFSNRRQFHAFYCGSERVVFKEVCP
jgi:hypothetical protein